MARDEGLEELLRGLLDDAPGLTEKAMFGGRAWLLHGHLLCGARDDGVLVRLGKGNDSWALQMKGIVPLVSRGRALSGWVRVAPETFAKDALARKLIDAAFVFVRALPPKVVTSAAQSPLRKRTEMKAFRVPLSQQRELVEAPERPRNKQAKAKTARPVANAKRAPTKVANAPRLNAAWHKLHRMPKNATTAQRLAWHLAHEKNCGCRPMPEKLRAIAR